MKIHSGTCCQFETRIFLGPPQQNLNIEFQNQLKCGGGIASNNTWKEATKNDWGFLFPVDAMAIVYRAKFLQSLQQMIAKGEVILTDEKAGKQLINLLYQKDWLVYAKAPFGGPQAVIGYLGRYTHKVAISNIEYPV